MRTGNANRECRSGVHSALFHSNSNGCRSQIDVKSLRDRVGSLVIGDRLADGSVGQEVVGQSHSGYSWVWENNTTPGGMPRCELRKYPPRCPVLLHLPPANGFVASWRSAAAQESRWRTSRSSSMSCMIYSRQLRRRLSLRSLLAATWTCRR